MMDKFAIKFLRMLPIGLPIDECWIWTGSKLPRGYGHFHSRNGGNAYTHRLAYEIFVGPIPDGHIVRHQCDEPSCCNPRHLLTGTTADNVADKVARGRQRGGPNAPGRFKPTRSKLAQNSLLSKRWTT